MGKITKKSINAVLDVYRQASNDTVLKLTDSNDVVVMEIEIKTALTIPEKGIFVDRVVLPCFDDEGDFMPQYLDPLFMITLLQMTTNVPVIKDSISVLKEDGTETGEKTEIINIEKTYELCRAINLVRNVEDAKYKTLISELKQMVNDKLEYTKRMQINKSSSVLSALNPVLENVSKMISDGKFLQSLKDKTALDENEVGLDNLTLWENDNVAK